MITRRGALGAVAMSPIGMKAAIAEVATEQVMEAAMNTQEFEGLTAMYSPPSSPAEIAKDFLESRRQRRDLRANYRRYDHMKSWGAAFRQHVENELSEYYETREWLYFQPSEVRLLAEPALRAAGFLP